MSEGSASPGVIELRGLEALEAALASQPALLVYVHAPDCGICHVLWPRLHTVLTSRYPRLALARVDAAAAPEVAAALGAFTVPTAIVYFEGREHHRFTHAFGLNEVGAAIDRPYRLLFAEDGP